MNTSSTPAVTYAYADGSANTVRPTSVRYPNGRVVTTSYGAAGSDDDRLSRTSSYVDPGSVTLAAYTYLGLGSFVKVDCPPPQLRYRVTKYGFGIPAETCRKYQTMW